MLVADRSMITGGPGGLGRAKEEEMDNLGTFI